MLNKSKEYELLIVLDSVFEADNYSYTYNEITMKIIRIKNLHKNIQ